MKITLRPNNCFWRTGCAICGEGFELDSVNAAVPNDDDQSKWLDVCRGCIEAGPDGMKQRARAAAERVMEGARAAVRWADEFQGEAIDAPTLVQLELALDRRMVERYGMTREQAETGQTADGCPF